MKFGKCLKRTIEDIPSEWKPFIIQYKTLKRCIHKIVKELDDKGISQDVLKNMLDAAEEYKMEYSLEANSTHIRSYIKLDLSAHSSDIQLAEHALESIQIDFLKHNLDSVLPFPSLFSTDSSDMESTTTSDPYYDITAKTISVHNNSTINQSLHRRKYIELETDSEFFNTLLEEISQLNHFQQQNKDKYMVKVKKLGESLVDVTSPYKEDMYTWREIFQFYLKAEIFIGNTEADRDERDCENAQKQFKWFTNELSKMGLPRKLKSNSSREAFHEFLGINNDLIIMKHFQYLNKTAMSKILKKHDKQTCLNACLNFGKLLENDPYFSGNLSIYLLYHAMDQQLSTIAPQFEDYTCPVCTFIYWKPIRLYCGHVFCVRCLIKIERKGVQGMQGMRNCPICRSEDAVYKADAGNLDISLQNFIKLYFPREVKAKITENGKEEAKEIELLVGRHIRGSECQLM